MGTDLAVEAHDLVKVFGGKREVRALDGVSVSVARGSVLGLLGPNGAGKTTAVRILSTILPPDSGHATVLGHDVVHEADTVRRLIGLAGQYATVDENLTGRENIRMVGRLSHIPKRVCATRADELLEQFGLADAGNRTLKTYSGGMRRRLDLAAALVGRPPVLFLDEPTTGLDPQSRQDLWGVIERLVEAGTTVLLTTQYLEEADRLADRVVVVDHGTVIAEGTPAELKADLGTTVISVTLADAEAAREAVAVLTPVIDGKAPGADGATVELTVEDGPKVAAEVLRALDQRGMAVAGLALREPSLDDVFLALTGHRAEVTETTGGGTDPGSAPGGRGAGPAGAAPGTSGEPAGTSARRSRKQPATVAGHDGRGTR
jgi:ABC-2 type transport system ATP-binding protein